MSSDILEVKWTGPFSFHELIESEKNREEFNRPGVYLWVETRTDARELVYVGKSASSLWKRQLEHYMHFIGCSYEIPDPFGPRGNRWKLDVPSKEATETIFDLDKFLELVPFAFEYASQMRLYLAPMDAEKAKVIEGTLIYDEKPRDNTQGKQTEPTDSPKLIHVGAADWPSGHGHTIR